MEPFSSPAEGRGCNTSMQLFCTKILAWFMWRQATCAHVNHEPLGIVEIIHDHGDKINFKEVGVLKGLEQAYRIFILKFIRANGIQCCCIVAFEYAHFQ